MNFVLIATLVAISSAAQLPSRSYLPSQGQGQGSYSQSQTFQSSNTLGSGRPQQQEEKNAAILTLDQDSNAESGNFHYSFETSNGIRAEESSDGTNSKGGFSYKGDDGNTYSITFISGEGGFKAEGAHLPQAPPTPEAILLALQQNAKDEAAGIFDDGKYRAEDHGSGHTGSSHSSGHSSGHSFSSSSSSSSSSSGFSSGSHQTSFNPNSGYRY